MSILSDITKFKKDILVSPQYSVIKAQYSYLKEMTLRDY